VSSSGGQGCQKIGLVGGLVDREPPLEIAPQLLEISLTLIERALDAGNVEAPLVRIVLVMHNGAEHDVLVVAAAHTMAANSRIVADRCHRDLL
jgi:hypothetical protein